MEDQLAELMRAALAGREADYSAFLMTVAGLLRGFVRRRIGAARASDAEDVVQEILIAIHLKRQTWRSDEAILPWIYAIARYKVVDAFRRSGRRVEVPIDDVAELIAAPEQETASERDVERALSALPDGQRSVVAAISLEGRSIRETAETLGMKEGAVRVALHRGLQAVATRFGRERR